MKRNKQLIIRVSHKEFDALNERKTRPRLATWMRETCLNVTPAKPLLKVDPALLVNLARIGGNLNQLAKFANQTSSHLNNHASLINSIKLTHELSLIREDLNNLLRFHIHLEQNNDSEAI